MNSVCPNFRAEHRLTRLIRNGDRCLHSPSSTLEEDHHVKTLCQNGRLADALGLLDLMSDQGIQPSQSSYVAILQACTKLKALSEGKRVHQHIEKSGSKATLSLWTAVINMYTQCKSLADARLVFNSMPEKDLLFWNIMIAAFVKNDQCEEAIELFRLLKEEGVKPNAATFGSILKACSTPAHLSLGKEVHAYILKSGIRIDTFLGNTLITMYSKCGGLGEAHQVFNVMLERGVVTWTALLSGYAKHGQNDKALQLYGAMLRDGVQPNEVTFVSVLNACAGLGDIKQGMLIIADIEKSKIKMNIIMENALLDMYVKCGCLKKAQSLFSNMCRKDIVTYTTIIAGYARTGDSNEVFKLLREMERECLNPNEVTLVSIFNAYASLGNLQEGKVMHAYMSRIGMRADASDFLGGSLVDMYVKCGSVENAWQVFSVLPKKSVTVWNAMLDGLANQGNIVGSMKLLQQMGLLAEVNPNAATFTIILKMCANMAAMEHGKYVHDCIIKSGLDTADFVGSSLIDMYVKCGSIEEAQHVFEQFPNGDVVLWTAMISGYAQHGQGFEALQLSLLMQKEGVKSNHITFIGVLSACSRAGLVEEGCYYFDSIARDHGVTPSAEHYACIVDLLGRAGCLDEAESFITKMLHAPDAVVWRALLGACKAIDDMERAKRVAERIMKLEPEDEGAFVLLSNIYGATYRMDE